MQLALLKMRAGRPCKIDTFGWMGCGRMLLAKDFPFKLGGEKSELDILDWKISVGYNLKVLLPWVLSVRLLDSNHKVCKLLNDYITKYFKIVFGFERFPLKIIAVDPPTSRVQLNPNYHDQSAVSRQKLARPLSPKLVHISWFIFARSPSKKQASEHRKRP